MHILLDKLSAALIATTMLLMIFSVNSRNGQAMNETTVFYSVATKTENFAKILRRDLQGIENVLTILESDLGGNITEFRFVTRIGQDTTKRTITYRKEPIAVHNATQFYHVKRLVDGTYEGGSGDIITHWHIAALNEDAGSISDPDDAAQVLVQFEAASPMIETDVIKSIKWESRFFPPLRN